MPAGSGEVPCPVLTIQTDGPGTSAASDGSSQRGLYFANILSFLLKLEGPSHMGKLRPGAVEGMDDGPQKLLLVGSLCICRSEGQGLPDQLTRVGALPQTPLPPPFTLVSNFSFRGSPHLTTQDGSPDLTGPSKHLMILLASCEL